MSQQVQQVQQGSDRKRRRRNIVLAILAGGVVLGVGAAVTLAAWQDDEFANGTFTASQFDLQGQVSTSEGFADHATTPGAALAFDLNAINLDPNAVTYAPYGLRLNTGTTIPATITVTSPTTTGTVTNLSYAVYETSSFACDASATSGTALIAAGTPVGSVPTSTTLSLTAATAAAPGTPQYLCFVVTAGASIATGQTGTAVWDFTATP